MALGKTTWIQSRKTTWGPFPKQIIALGQFQTWKKIWARLGVQLSFIFVCPWAMSRWLRSHGSILVIIAMSRTRRRSLSTVLFWCLVHAWWCSSCSPQLVSEPNCSRHVWPRQSVTPQVCFSDLHLFPWGQPSSWKISPWYFLLSNCIVLFCFVLVFFCQRKVVKFSTLKQLNFCD